MCQSKKLTHPCGHNSYTFQYCSDSPSNGLPNTARKILCENWEGHEIVTPKFRMDNYCGRWDCNWFDMPDGRWKCCRYGSNDNTTGNCLGPARELLHLPGFGVKFEKGEPCAHVCCTKCSGLKINDKNLIHLLFQDVRVNPDDEVVAFNKAPKLRSPDKHDFEIWVDEYDREENTDQMGKENIFQADESNTSTGSGIWEDVEVHEDNTIQPDNEEVLPADASNTPSAAVGELNTLYPADDKSSILFSAADLESYTSTTSNSSDDIRIIPGIYTRWGDGWDLESYSSEFENSVADDDPAGFEFALDSYYWAERGDRIFHDDAYLLHVIDESSEED
ncbi:hypothetical protein B0H66DRAFT_538545 [Apodospora peruviana]|uniref:Uncharacterized protein n=1 Tax=Apodospora peruviana TaxID=516989 RepID=A0AAE0HUK1_9PEZI|nr:hypothetical protein B0H66DRAFT_538545 [Apodospora peruviana]